MKESKGQATKDHIVHEGLILASVKGLVNISIGGLAEKAAMSRSGLFAHFLSKEQLQLEILKHAATLFEELVLKPCLLIESSRGRLQFLVDNMPGWHEKTEPQLPGGCIFLTATLEFDDRPGKVKDFLLNQQKSFLRFLEHTHRQAVQTEGLADTLTDEDFAFIFYSIYMGYNQYKKFFGYEDAKKYAVKHYSQLLSDQAGPLDDSLNSPS